MSSGVGNLGLAVAAALLVGCASAPTVGPHESGVWGYLRLVPHEGVSTDHAQAYSDRRLAGVELVDYSHPAFAVVYTETPASETPDLLLAIGADSRAVVIEPRLAAHHAGGVVQIVNQTDSTHTVSCPQAGRVEPIAPGQRLTIRLGAGAHDFYLLDIDGVRGQVFAAPGDFAVVSSSGRYELTGLAPGPQQIHAWHPRFPPITAQAELRAGAVVRLDLEMGVSAGRR